MTVSHASGDALQTVKRLPDASVDLVATSPTRSLTPLSLTPQPAAHPQEVNA